MMNEKMQYAIMQEKALSFVMQHPGLPRDSPTISFWQESPHPIGSVQSLELPPRVDIAIIGSGITGCSVANTLLNHPNLRSKHIMVLEARNLMSGPTGRNGGHLALPTFGDFPMVAELYVEEKAAEVVRFLVKTVQPLLETPGSARVGQLASFCQRL